MKVKELIEKLQEFDGDKEVVIHFDYDGYPAEEDILAVFCDLEYDPDDPLHIKNQKWVIKISGIERET